MEGQIEKSYKMQLNLVLKNDENIIFLEYKYDTELFTCLIQCPFILQ